MLLQINNKALFECNASDFEVLLHNQDYRENQYLEYKEDFSFWKVPKGESLPKIIEFRNDICSFANAEGGCIIFGIRDVQGTADQLCGVEIENPDKLELDLRNKLTTIMPKVPPVNFRFVSLDNGRYLVLVFIEHDYFAPYIHIEEQKNYKIYKRVGNQKSIIGYTELKNMFIQSHVLEEEIYEFRKKRIDYFRNSGDRKFERFMLLHIIPESFLNDRKELFIIERKRQKNFSAVFTGTKIDSRSLPCVDGLRYINTLGEEEAIIYNNGVAEFMLPLSKYVSLLGDGLFFYNEEIWNYIDYVLQGYQASIPELFGKQRYFGCVSIIGCKDVISEENGYAGNKTVIDRDVIICYPNAFMNINDKESFYLDMKKLHLEYLLSVGIKKSEKVNELIEAIYPE